MHCRDAILLIAPLLLIAPSRVAADTRPVVKVMMGEATDRGATYSYRVVNASAVEVRGFAVGLDYVTLTATLPSAPESVRSPSTWTYDVVRTEEAAIWHVGWRGPDSPVAPGASLSGFVVQVARRDAAYESGPVTIYLSNGWIVSPLQLEQPVVPVLSCVEEDPVTHALAARFQYENRNSYDVPLQVGPANRFVPGAENRGQPTTFLAPPARPEQVRVPLVAGESLTWELGASLVSATSQSPRCTP